MRPATLQHSVFGGVVDMPVEGDGIGDTQLLGVFDQALPPPSAADDVEVQVRYPAAQRRDRLECVLDLLMRHQSGQHHHARRRRTPPEKSVRRGFVKAVADHRDPGRVDPEVGEITRRGQRDRDVLIVAVQPRRESRFDEPAEPGQETAGDRPLLAMTVMHSTTTRRPKASRARNGSPIWLSITTSGRTLRSGPRPSRAATIAKPAQI